MSLALQQGKTDVKRTFATTVQHVMDMEANFKEEYWNEALRVLEAEERKERNKMLLPWVVLAAVLLMCLGSAIYMFAFASNGQVPGHSQDQVLAQQREVLSHGFIQEEAQGQMSNQLSPSQNHPTATHRSASTHSQNNHLANTGENQDNNDLANAGENQDNIHLANAQNITSNTANVKVVNNQAQTDKKDGDEEADQQATGSDNVEIPGNEGTWSATNPPTGGLLVNQDTQDMRATLPAAGTYAGLKIDAQPARVIRFNNGIKADVSYKGFDYHAPFPFKENAFYVFAGNSFLTGYGSRKGDITFNPEVGVGYERVFGRHWSADVALSYFQVGGITHAAEFAQTELGFGYHTTLTTISTYKLHFAYLPVTVNWDFTKRSALIAGFGVEALVNGLSDVTVTEIDNFSEQQVSKTRDWGYTNGYRTFNASLLAGYEFRVTKRFTLGAQYQYGLREITKANVYGQEFRDRNSRLRVYLKFNIQ
ncbi:MAG: outer membrane beta-barrel protein [Flavobacteriales bacterium]|nr:outer membrane beta-barrel protein [Flavobacteriales bacterium]